MGTFAMGNAAQETTTTTGTGGVYDLDGAVTGFRAISAEISTTEDSIFRIDDDSNFEILRATLTTGSPDTLTAVTYIETSNGGSAVNWTAGTRNVSLVVAAHQLISLVDPDNQTAGLMARTAADTITARTLAVSPAGPITITDGDGVSGAPTLVQTNVPNQTQAESITGSWTYTVPQTFGGAVTRFSGLTANEHVFWYDAGGADRIIQWTRAGVDDYRLSVWDGGAVEEVPTNADIPFESVTVGQVLVADTTSTYAAKGSDLPVLVSSLAASGAAFYDIELDPNTDGFTKYEVRLLDVRVATDGADLEMLISDDDNVSQETGASTYNSIVATTSNAVNIKTGGTEAHVELTDPAQGIGSDASPMAILSGKLHINNSGDATIPFNMNWELGYFASDASHMTINHGYMTVDSSITVTRATHIRIQTSTGNFTGTIQLYGILV